MQDFDGSGTLSVNEFLEGARLAKKQREEHNKMLAKELFPAKGAAGSETIFKAERKSGDGLQRSATARPSKRGLMRTTTT